MLIHLKVRNPTHWVQLSIQYNLASWTISMSLYMFLDTFHDLNCFSPQGFCVCWLDWQTWLDLYQTWYKARVVPDPLDLLFYFFSAKSDKLLAATLEETLQWLWPCTKLMTLSRINPKFIFFFQRSNAPLEFYLNGNMDTTLSVQ